jgi:hypothetical protein
MRKEMKQRAIANFWSHVHRTDECWYWTGKVDEKGYGLTGWGRAHRVSYELCTNELIPSDVMILHKCNNTLCVNPAHLYKGTALDNARDRAECRSPYLQIKFLLGELWLMQRMRDKGVTIKHIAKCFKCASSTISYHTTRPPNLAVSNLRIHLK